MSDIIQNWTEFFREFNSLSCPNKDFGCLWHPEHFVDEYLVQNYENSHSIFWYFLGCPTVIIFVVVVVVHYLDVLFFKCIENLPFMIQATSWHSCMLYCSGFNVHSMQIAYYANRLMAWQVTFRTAKTYFSDWGVRRTGGKASFQTL